MAAFSANAFFTSAFSTNAFFFDSGGPAITWIDGVGYGKVDGDTVVSLAYDNIGTVKSTVSQDQMDSIVRRWKV